MSIRKSAIGWAVAAVAALVPLNSQAAPKTDTQQQCSASALWQASSERAQFLGEIKKWGFVNYRTYIAVLDDMYKALDKKNINYQNVTAGEFLNAQAVSFGEAAKAHLGQLKAIRRTPILDIEGQDTFCQGYDSSPKECPGTRFAISDLNASTKVSTNPTVIKSLGNGEGIGFSVTAYFLPPRGSEGGNGIPVIEAQGKFEPSTSFKDFAAGIQASYKRSAELLGADAVRSINMQPSIPAQIAVCRGLLEPAGH